MILTPHAEDKRSDFIFFLIFFFNGTAITWFNTTDLSLVVMSILGYWYIFLIKREVLDRIFIYVILYWTAINLFSLLVLGGEGFSYLTFGGSLLKIFIGYAFLKITKEYFIVWYEKIVFILAIISIPFYILQLINPNIFSSIPFNFVEQSRMIGGDWNGIIYNYAPMHITQNSGFAGEPGTFGYYLGLAMIFNLILNRGKVNGRLMTFVLIGFTTLSTTFYITLSLFFLFFILRSTIWIKLSFSLILIPALILIYQLPFMGEKMNTYLADTNSFMEAEIIDSDRINRIAKFVNDVNDVIQYPIGYGTNESGLSTNIYNRVITGTNGISRIALMFGVFGLTYFLFIYFKLVDKLSLSLKGNYIFTIIILLYIAANPMERDYYAMGLFWGFFIINKKDIEKLLNAINKDPSFSMSQIKNEKKPKPIALMNTVQREN